MGHNFIPCDRDQQFLLPPSVNEWLPDDHLARFVVQVVELFDLSGFYARRRADGWGRACYDPKMMVALLVYAYATGTRSSRAIERRCTEDIALRFICANECPDHATIARFVVAHESELIDLFHQTVRIAAEVGLVRVGIIALDSTRVEADASPGANRIPESVRAEIEDIVHQARATDDEEARLYGVDKRGDEIPEDLIDSDARLARLVAAKARLDADDAPEQAKYQAALAADQAHFERTGKRRPGPPRKPPQERWDYGKRHRNKVNLTDPDSRIVSTANGGFIQGYNAQVVTTVDQITIACGVLGGANDYGDLGPMVTQATANLEAAGIATKAGVLVADAGYLSDDNLALEDDLGVELLIATKNHKRASAHNSDPPRGRIPKHLSATERMDRKLKTKRGKKSYGKRAGAVEPVIGQQRQRGMGRFRRRGLAACNCEWHIDQTVHNILKIRTFGKSLPRRGGSRRSRIKSHLAGAMRCRVIRPVKSL